MRFHFTKLVLIASVFTALFGCGTKGPLYIPEQAYPQPTQSEPATQAN